MQLFSAMAGLNNYTKVSITIVYGFLKFVSSGSNKILYFINDITREILKKLHFFLQAYKQNETYILLIGKRVWWYFSYWIN